MILITRLDGKEFFVNAELIQYIESTPDTVITLINNTKLIVKEKPELLVARIIAYRQKIQSKDFLENTGA
jgi:flagellar protein FlbD